MLSSGSDLSLPMYPWPSFSMASATVRVRGVLWLLPWWVRERAWVCWWADPQVQLTSDQCWTNVRIVKDERYNNYNNFECFDLHSSEFYVIKLTHLLACIYITPACLQFNSKYTLEKWEFICSACASHRIYCWCFWMLLD